MQIASTHALSPDFLLEVSTELPAISAIDAAHKSGHGFIGAACLHLVVGALSLLALSALELIGGLLADLSPLAFPQGMGSDLLDFFFLAFAGHVFRRERGKGFGSDVSFS